LTRPSEKHLDDAELDALVSLPDRVTASGQISQPIQSEALRHVESCEDCNRKVQMHKRAQDELFLLKSSAPPPAGPRCPPEGTDWLEAVSGLLPEPKARELMSHAAQCDHCGPFLRRAAEIVADEATPAEESTLAGLKSVQHNWQQGLAERLQRNMRSHHQKGQLTRRWEGPYSWLRVAFAVAAVAVVIVAGWLGPRLLHPPSAEQLLAQAYSEHRTLDVRIAGARYAPLRVERGAVGSNLDKPSALLKAESLIGENLGKYPDNPSWLQAKARADLLDGNYESAITSLQRALESEPESPQLLTDLASAYFERAESANRPIDYGDAIESLGKALAKSPDDPVALFNRALISERMFLYTQAVDDWEHYLRIDPRGEWADDARNRLAALQEKLKQHQQSLAEPLLLPSEIAGRGRDDAALRTKIDERIEDYLTLAISEWLPKAYPLTPQERFHTDAPRAALRIVADVSNRNHRDRWLTDLLSGASSQIFPAAVGRLSQAVNDDDVGDNVAARQHASEAERLFAAAGSDAGSLRASVEYMFASQDAQNGEECLRAAKGVELRLSRYPYRWLTAQYDIEEGNCVWFLGNLGTARHAFAQASKEAESSAYGAIYLRAQDHLSLLEGTVGDLPSAWSRNQKALGRFWSGRFPAMRGYNLYYGRYEFARWMQEPYLQMTAWRSGLALSESFDDKVLRAMAHSLMASAAVAAEEPQIAEKELAKANELFAAAPQIESTRIDLMETETRIAEVEASEGEAQQAVSRLRKLEPEVSKLSDRFLEILFYTTLGDAESRIGDFSDAESTLHSAVALAELHLQSVKDDKSRLEWSERTSRTYRNLVQLHLRQGDVQGALEIWEWYRGASLRMGKKGSPAVSSPVQQVAEVPSLSELHEVGSRLPRLMNETVLTYALLPQGLAIWVFDDRGVVAHWTEGKAGDVERVANRFRSLCSDPTSDDQDLKQNARLLYDLLAAPVEQHLTVARTLVIELDEGLAGLPFEALLDTHNHYFGDRGPVVSSLGFYYQSNPHIFGPIAPQTSALVAAVSTSQAVTDTPLSPLPDAALEGETVATSFISARLLSGREATVNAVLSQLPYTSIFHFAGHAISSSQRTGLLLSDAILDASSLRENSLSKMRLAVFSACDTQDGTSGVYASDSLVRAFLRAGVPQVVASRWNVDSLASREFMVSFYRALLRGASVAESVKQAQADLRSRPGMAHPYYWSAFTAFGAV
jgi:CHAT domain-containing protein